MRGRSKAGWWGVVVEAPDAHALARFYSTLLGWPISSQGPNGAAIPVSGTTSFLTFENSPDYTPPAWPASPGHQQIMMHIDIAVDELDTAVADAINLGATLAEFQPNDDIRVLIDPAGHPFCLYLDT
jgi:catechol-2,3-dioxygenase